MGSIIKKIVSILLTILLLFSSASPVLATINYGYDLNGNLLSDGVNCYTYNDANQLSVVKVCSSGKVLAEYIYDFDGRRIVKEEYVNGVVSQSIYSPEKEYETKKLASGTVENTTYYYANDELIAKKNSDGSRNYYLNDHLGSTSVLTNQSGGVIEESSYYPFGEVRVGGLKSKYQFTGQEKDSDTGLNYYGARYYNSHIFHFTQPDSLLPDPYDPQQLNRYSYVRNNPLKYTDPSGHIIAELLAIGGATAFFSGFLLPTASIVAGGLTGGYECMIEQACSGNYLQYAGAGAQYTLEKTKNAAVGLMVAGQGLVDVGNFVNYAKNSLSALNNFKDISKHRSNRGLPAVNLVKNKNNLHGNSLESAKTTVLYSLRNLGSDELVKWGETASSSRYTRKFFGANELYIRMEAFGSKKEMHILQHNLLEEYLKKNTRLPVFNKSLY